MNKLRFAFLAVATLAIGLLTGCQTNSNPQTPGEKEEQATRRAKRIAEMATFDVGILELKGKQNTLENRTALKNITNELAGFLGASNITSGDVSAYISRLPIRELKTVEGQIISGAVLVIVDEVIGDKITVDGSKLTPVIEAAIKGFGRAIEFAEQNPYVPPAPKPPKITNAVPRAALPTPPERDFAMEMMMPRASMKAESFSLIVNPTIRVSWMGAVVLQTYVVMSTTDFLTWTEVARTTGSAIEFPANGQHVFYAVFKDRYFPTVEWDRNPEPNVMYRIYAGKSPRLYDVVLEVGEAIQGTVQTDHRTVYVAVTAYYPEGLESDFSEEIYFRPPSLPVHIARL